MLTPDAFSRARDFLLTQGRPLERALFVHEFQGGPVGPAIEALAAFANPDGGFGHALEPDSRAPESGALATSIGLRTAAELDLPAEHPLVGGAVAYLLDTLDPATLTWRIIPEAAANAPHAPWWSQTDGALERTFSKFVLNPRGDLLALLWHSATLVPRARLEEITDSFVQAAASGVAPHDVNGHLNLAEFVSEKNVPGMYRVPVLEYLQDVLPTRVQRTPEDFAAHGLPPLALAPRPGTPLHDVLADAVEGHLDILERTQAPDGSWGPAWSWGPFFPDVWPQAERDWRSVLTLQNLRFLRDHGRLPR